ncbi:hypothetical protein [Actinoplanes sp. NPDC089786]|uniref:hypothetical protein n=1 Tax=Actinoplanes sp. NPDC089786 TaxID=3155185 RepID=UPI00343259BC
MTLGGQAVLVVEYPCEQFCRIEVDLSGEQSGVTLKQLREKADTAHERVHNPDSAEPAEPIADEPVTGRPAATIFLSAPGRNSDQRRR